MIQAQCLTRLTVSAASGLVVEGASIWVIADDLASLYRYDFAGTLLERVALFGSGGTASELNLPKALKPDLEALARLPDGSLLALGSGSRPQRRTACHVDPMRSVAPVDLSPLYARLEAELPALNIEGAVVHDGALVLAHRGTAGEDALIELDLERAMAGLARGQLGAEALRRIRRLALGTLGTARLAFTDLANGPDGRLWFSAAAELTDDPYDDGAVRGSIVGCLDRDGALLWHDEVTPVCKIEGLHWQADADGGCWLAVADADDPAQRAPLLALPMRRIDG